MGAAQGRAGGGLQGSGVRQGGDPETTQRDRWSQRWLMILLMIPIFLVDFHVEDYEIIRYIDI